VPRPNQLRRSIHNFVIVYPGVALIVDGVSTAVEVDVVAVVVGVVPTDVDARVIAVCRRLMPVARALLEILSVAAGALHMVVAAALQKVTVTCRCVLGLRVDFIAFSINEILANSRRVVTTVYKIMRVNIQFRPILLCCQLYVLPDLRKLNCVYLQD